MKDNNIRESREIKPADKKDNAFVRFLKFVFVKNAALKGLALVLGFLMWMIISIF